MAKRGCVEIRARRQLPNTPTIGVDSPINGFPSLTIENMEAEDVKMRRKSSRGEGNRHSWCTPPAINGGMAERRQLSVGDDRRCADSSQCSPTTRAMNQPESQQSSRNFLTVDQSYRSVSPVASGSAVQRRIQYLQTRQRSVGYRDSRSPVDNCDYLFSASFDCASTAHNGTATTPNRTAAPNGRLQPQRADSTNSDDSIPENGLGKRGRVRSASSNSSLNTISRKVTPSESRKPSRGMRSASSAATKNPIRNGSDKSSSRSPVVAKLPSISTSSQSIIVSCMENARGDIASRIVQRMAHKRDDFAQFCANLTGEQMADMLNSLKQLLTDVVGHISSAEKVREISVKFGIDQVPKRGFGFKADFFAVMANALTTECVFLDGAAHQPTETIEAWAELVELMFSNVRDGYYQQIRYMRRNSHCFNSMFSCSSDTDGGDAARHPSEAVAPRYKSAGQLDQLAAEAFPAPGVVIRL